MIMFKIHKIKQGNFTFLYMSDNLLIAYSEPSISWGFFDDKACISWKICVWSTTAFEGRFEPSNNEKTRFSCHLQSFEKATFLFSQELRFIVWPGLLYRRSEKQLFFRLFCWLFVAFFSHNLISYSWVSIELICSVLVALFLAFPSMQLDIFHATLLRICVWKQVPTRVNIELSNENNDSHWYKLELSSWWMPKITGCECIFCVIEVKVRANDRSL